MVLHPCKPKKLNTTRQARNNYEKPLNLLAEKALERTALPHGKRGKHYTTIGWGEELPYPTENYQNHKKITSSSCHNIFTIARSQFLIDQNKIK